MRSETFADHYSQARMFWQSMSEPEQGHIVGAFGFELGQVETVSIRQRMLGHLEIIAPELSARVAHVLGMEGQAQAVEPAVAPIDLKPSPSLSLVKKAKPTLQGRSVGVLVSDGTDTAIVESLRATLATAGARLVVVAPKIGGAKGKGGPIAVDKALEAGPSLLFDAVVLAVSERGAKELAKHPAAVDWVRNAFGHLKRIGFVPESAALLDAAGVTADDGVIELSGAKAVSAFVTAAKQGRLWARESQLANHEASRKVVAPAR